MGLNERLIGFLLLFFSSPVQDCFTCNYTLLSLSLVKDPYLRWSWTRKHERFYRGSRSCVRAGEFVKLLLDHPIALRTINKCRQYTASIDFKYIFCASDMRRQMRISLLPQQNGSSKIIESVHKFQVVLHNFYTFWHSPKSFRLSIVFDQPFQLRLSVVKQSKRLQHTHNLLQKLALACLKRVLEHSPVVNSPSSFLGHTENNKTLHIITNKFSQTRQEHFENGTCLLNTKVFVPGQDHTEKVDLCKGYWNPQRK